MRRLPTFGLSPAGLGFEPRFTASKAGVLPLDDPAGLSPMFNP